MNKYILPTILILASGGLFYFYMKNKGNKDKTTEENNDDSNTQSTQSSSTQTTPKQTTPKTISWNNNKILKLGSKGIEVRMLQLFLNLGLRQANKPLLETKSGIFGKKTEEALFYIFRVKQITIGTIRAGYIKSGKDWEYLKKQAAIQLAK